MAYGPEPKTTPARAKTLMVQLYKKQVQRYIQCLELHPRARYAQQTAQGSSSWLATPFHENGGTVDDRTWQTIIRSRLLMTTLGGPEPPDPAAAPTCARKCHGSARMCGKSLDDKGRHDAICKIGATSTRDTTE